MCKDCTNAENANTELVFIVAALITFFGLMASAVAFLHDKWLDNSASVLISVQQVVQVGLVRWFFVVIFSYCVDWLISLLDSFGRVGLG